MREPIDILGLGCVAVDDTLYVEGYPAPDAKLPVLMRERQCGGLTATALVAAARLGARCAYGGTLGDDESSQYVLHQLAAENIDVSLVRRVSEARPICSTIIVDQQRGTRNIFYDLNGVMALPAGWPGDETLGNVRALIVDHFSTEAQIHAARIARDAGIPIIADFECDDGPHFEPLLDLVDHLIVSQDFAERLTGCKDPSEAILALWAEARRATAVTGGADGCWFAVRSDDSREDAFQPRRIQSDQVGVLAPPIVQHQPAYAVSAVDTTGCGDVFHGAYAAAMVRGSAISSAIRFAAAAAALKATRRGGQAGAPRLAEVKQFMETRS